MKLNTWLLIIHCTLVLLPVSLFAAEEADKSDVHDVYVRFTTTPRGANVFCSTMPTGKRFLGRADKRRTILLPQGRYKFTFAKPGYRLEKRLLDIKKREVHYHIRLQKVSQPSKIRPFVLHLRHVSGDHWNRTALIEYKKEEYVTENGWVSPDGAFEIEEIRSDRVKVRHLHDGNAYWFLER